MTVVSVIYILLLTYVRFDSSCTLNTISPFFSVNIFWGLRSRCIIFFEWQKATASKILYKKLFIKFSFNMLSLYEIKNLRRSHSIYSKSKYNFELFKTTSINLTILGWSNSLKIVISLTFL